MRTAALLALLALTALACGGSAPTAPGSAAVDAAPPRGRESEPEPLPPPEPQAAATPPGDPDWITAAVAEALEWEVQPGTEPGDDPERPGQLRGFFRSHPEYADREVRQRLADLACAFGTEGAHDRLDGPGPKPRTMDLDNADYRVVVAHSDRWCTSDDWTWYVAEVNTAVQDRGLAFVYADADVSELVLTHAGAELARVPLKGQGYLFARSGAAPRDHGHDVSDGVLSDAWDYFGIEAETPSGAAAPDGE